MLAQCADWLLAVSAEWDFAEARPRSYPVTAEGGRLSGRLREVLLDALPALVAERPDAFLAGFLETGRTIAGGASDAASLSRALDQLFEATVDELSRSGLSGWHRPWWQLFERLRIAFLAHADPSDQELLELFAGFCAEHVQPMLGDLPFEALGLRRGPKGERTVAVLDLGGAARGGRERTLEPGPAAWRLGSSLEAGSCENTVGCTVPGHADLQLVAVLGRRLAPDVSSLVSTCIQALASMLGLYLSKRQLEQHRASLEPGDRREETIETLAATLRQWAGYERCALFSFDAGSGLVEGLVGNGVSTAQIRAIREPLTRMPLFERALSEDQPSHVRDTWAGGAVPIAYVRRFGLTSLLIVPMRAGTSTIGFAAMDQAGIPFAGVRHPRQLAELGLEIGSSLQGELGRYGRVTIGRSTATAAMLSHREMAVLQYVAEGRTLNEAAQEIFLSPYTIRDYLLSAMHKLGAQNRAEAVVRATKLGLVV